MGSARFPTSPTSPLQQPIVIMTEPASGSAGSMNATTFDIIANDHQDGMLTKEPKKTSEAAEKDKLLLDFRTITTMLQALGIYSDIPPPRQKPKTSKPATVANELRVLNALATLFVRRNGVVAVASTGGHPYGDDVNVLAVESKDLGYLALENARPQACTSAVPKPKFARGKEPVEIDELKDAVLK